MATFNLITKEEYKQGDTIYINFNNFFIVKFIYDKKYEKLIFKKFNIIVDYKLFFNEYKKNKFASTSFGRFNPFKCNEKYIKFTSKRKFENKINSLTLNASINLGTILNLLDKTTRTYISNEYREFDTNLNRSNLIVGGGSNFNHSTYKINNKKVFETANTIIISKNINKSKTKLLNLQDNYDRIISRKKIYKFNLHNYKYIQHMNCCGFAYLSIGSNHLTIKDDELKFLDTYSVADSEKYKEKFKEFIINKYYEEIVTLISSSILTNRKSLLFYLLGQKIYLNFEDTTTNRSIYAAKIYKRLREFNNIINQAVINKLIENFRTEKIENNKIIIKS